MNVYSDEIECSSLVRHCEDCINAWIEQDDVLSDTVDALVVPDNMDLGSVQYNAKFLTDEELSRCNNDPNEDVHIEIIEDDEGGEGVE